MTHIVQPCVRETSLTTGTVDFTLAGRMFGSFPFAEFMATGDTCDYCATYGDTLEEGLGTMGADGKLQRTTVYRARHANGTTNTTKVSFAAGVKTIVMVYGTPRIADLIALALKAIRSDIVQSLSNAEKRQALDNLGLFPTGTKMLFRQSAAPPGWTKDTTHNDKALRVVSGSIVDGGSIDFSTCFSRTATDAFTLSQANLPSVTWPDTLSVSINESPHSHPGLGPYKTGGSTAGAQATPILGAGGIDIPTSAASTGISATKNGSVTSGGAGTSKTAGMDIRVKYIDLIIATKD